jgi:hypothetical protein
MVKTSDHVELLKKLTDGIANLLADHKALSEDSEKDGLKKRVAGLKCRYRLQCHLRDDSIKNFANSYHDELAAECAGKLADLARALSATDQSVEAHPASQAFKSESVVTGINAAIGLHDKILDFDKVT